MEEKKQVSLQERASQQIQERAMQGFYTQISSTLRYDGKSIEQTERTPEVRERFRAFFLEELLQNYPELSETERTETVDDAFNQLVELCKRDFMEYKTKERKMARLIYLLVIVILLVAFLFYKLGWVVGK